MTKMKGILNNPLDRQFAVILCPDDWEAADEDYILNADLNLIKKCNPHVGITVQPDFYQGELAKAKQNVDYRKEVLTKLFNVFSSNRVTEWIKNEQARRVQVQRNVQDCLYSAGWRTFVGLDFGGTDDLFAITTLSVDYNKRETMQGRFFADLFAWIVESAIEKSTNRPLYEQWIRQGWLRVSPGDTFDPNLAINELMELNTGGVDLTMFGFDPAQSRWPINTLKAWLQTLGIDAATIQQMVVPVSQNYMTHNGLIGEVEHMIFTAPEEWLQLSMNPMWPWMFGNCRIDESGNGNRKVVKAAPSQKVDGVHALIDAMYCFDLSEGRIE